MQTEQSKNGSKKTVTRERLGARKPRVSWEMCLAVLDDPKTRSVALRVLARAEIKPSETWSHRATKEATADALARAEDWLELDRPKSPDRARIKSVRRRLEWDICP